MTFLNKKSPFCLFFSHFCVVQIVPVCVHSHCLSLHVTCVCSARCFLSLMCVFLCDRERREIAGDKPPDLSGFCGSYVNGKLYIFAGCDQAGYTNQVSDVKMSSHFGL